MRHVPIAEFKDKLSEIVAAVEAGEEIVITRHGRDVVRLVAAQGDRAAQREAAFAALTALREELRARRIQASRDEIREWINEGRR